MTNSRAGQDRTNLMSVMLSYRWSSRHLRYCFCELEVRIAGRSSPCRRVRLYGYRAPAQSETGSASAAVCLPSWSFPRFGERWIETRAECEAGRGRFPKDASRSSRAIAYLFPTQPDRAECIGREAGANRRRRRRTGCVRQLSRWQSETPSVAHGPPDRSCAEPWDCRRLDGAPG